MHTRTGLPPFKLPSVPPPDKAAGHDIADTAFWVNVSRAKRLELSQDPFAHLWVTPASAKLWEEMAREVYPDSDISVSLRCRYYLERMKAFADANPRTAVVNVAAGFTAYPFLLPKNCRTLEIDYPKVVALKQSRTNGWLAEGVLPERRVEYFGADLAGDKDLDRLQERLAMWIGRDKGFAVLEGITYYLPRQSLDRIIAILARVLPPGSQLAMDHWLPDADTYPVFVRFRRHMNEAFGWSGHAFNLMDDARIASMPGFKTLETLDYAQVERMYSPTRTMQTKQTHFPTHFQLLARE